MTKFRYTYEDVKEYIEVVSGSECQLLSKDYRNCKQKLSIRCKCNNVFETTFDSFRHSNKRRCKICVRKNSPLRTTLEDAQKYCCDNIRGYEILDIKFIQSNNRNTLYVLMKCSNDEHESYWAQWNKVKKGQRCKKCYHESRKDKSITWDKNAILKILSKYNLTVIDTNYEFKNSRYKIPCMNQDGYYIDANVLTLSNGNTPHIFMHNKHAIDNLKILCGKYGWTLLPNQKWKTIKAKYDIMNKEGYKARISIEPLMYGSNPDIFHTSNPYTIDNIDTYCKLHRPSYAIVSERYTGMDELLGFKYLGDEVDITDNERYFKTTLNRFIHSNQEHPIFNASKGETAIARWLIGNKIDFKREYTFDDCKKESYLRFDFAVFNNLGELDSLIEYQGIQHYEPVEYFGGDDKFAIQKEYDEFKRGYCIKNNISLLIIPHWELDNVANVLNKNILKQ